MLEPASPAQITSQLDRILNDPLFERSPRLGGFLRFSVERALAGTAGDLKEYAIGVEVFKRPADYDPQTDPIVRIMAGRLRARLAEYYLSRGAADPILIDLPRGGYTPRFSVHRRMQPVLQRVRRDSVGREAESAALGDIWRIIPLTGGRFVTVSGDAGIGKTTFVEDFLAEIDSAAIIGRGRCSERLAETDAFAPILDALDGLARLGGDISQTLQSAAPAWYAQVTTTNSKPQTQERMRREFAAFIEQAARLRPLIVFLEDLHWADASTCDLLAYIGQRIAGAAVLVVATYRPGPVLAARHPFLPLKLRLEGWGISRDIPLSFLTRDNVRQYVANTFPGNGFPENLAGIIYERTEGHPLFFTGLLRYLVDTGVLALRDGVWGLGSSTTVVRRVIPAGTHAMIGVKLAELGQADRDILRCGAIQGVQFDSAVVAQVLSMDSVFVEERLSELDRIHRLVSAAGEQDRPGLPLSVRYQFTHVFYQNALYVSSTPSQLASDSLAVAQVLSGLGEETARLLAAELAVLYESGRDYPNASRHFLQAARNAARVFAYPEAILLAERGLKTLAKLGESRSRDEQELAYLLTIGMAMMSTRGYAAPEVERIYRQARELCRKLNDLRRLVPVLWAIHTCVTNAGRLSESLEVARELRAAADALNHKESIVESLHALGTTLAFMGRLKEARQTLERIFEIAPVAQHEFRGSLFVIDPLVTSLSMLARLVTLMGDFDAGRRMAAEALELAQRLAHPHSLAYARFWIGWILQTGGDHPQALPHLEAAMEMGSSHGLPLIVEWGRIVRGAAIAQLGRLEEGIAEIEQSIAAQDAMGSGLERPYCLTLLAEALLARGDAPRALQLLDQALDLAARTQSLDFQSESHRLRGQALRVLRHPEPAVRAEFETALRLARDSGCLLLERRINQARAHALP